MGYMVGAIAWSRNEEGNSIILNLLAIILSGIWMIIGYYITEGRLYGHWASPVASRPGNVTPIVIGLLLGLPIAKVLRRYKKYI
jgi:uncharacterized membrane protein